MDEPSIQVLAWLRRYQQPPRCGCFPLADYVMATDAGTVLCHRPHSPASLLAPCPSTGALPPGLGHLDRREQPHHGLGTDLSSGEQQRPPRMGGIIIQTPLLQLVLVPPGGWLRGHPVFLWPGLERKALCLSPSSRTASGKGPGNDCPKWQDPQP